MAIRKYIESAARTYHFREGSFDAFYQWLEHPFQPYSYQNDTNSIATTLLNEWQTSADSITMLVTQVRISDDDKEEVYQQFKNDTDVVVFDRSYFTNQWVSASLYFIVPHIPGTTDLVWPYRTDFDKFSAHAHQLDNHLRPDGYFGD